MQIKILTTNEKDLWNGYLEELPIDQQDIYYTPEYYELFEKNGDGKDFELDPDFELDKTK